MSIEAGEMYILDVHPSNKYICPECRRVIGAETASIANGRLVIAKEEVSYVPVRCKCGVLDVAPPGWWYVTSGPYYCVVAPEWLIPLYHSENIVSQEEKEDSDD